MTKEQVDKIIVGELPHWLDFYITPRFETSNEKNQWLTRIQTIGRGSVEPEGDRLKVSYSWYVLTGLKIPERKDKPNLQGCIRF